MFRVSIHISPRLQPLRYSRFREQPIKRELSAKTSAKDLIEACGIPHTEIDLILANNAPVDFNFSVDQAMAIEAFGCGRIFWRGSHAQRLRVEQYLEIARESASGGTNGTQGGI